MRKNTPAGGTAAEGDTQWRRCTGAVWCTRYERCGASFTYITGLTTVLVGIVGLAFNFRNSQEERKERRIERRDDYQEWYRRNLFERRLTAVQEAYSWLMRLNVALNRADPRQPDSEANEELRQIAHQARTWYDANVLYLHDNLPASSPWIGLTNAAMPMDQEDHSISAFGTSITRPIQ